RFNMIDNDVGKIGGSGNEVISEGAVRELTFGRVDEFLIERLTNALRDSAAYLFADKQGIYDHAEIIDSPVLQQFYEAGAHVDLGETGLNAVGWNECRPIV